MGIGKRLDKNELDRRIKEKEKMQTKNTFANISGLSITLKDL